MLSRNDILNAKEIYLSEHDELLIPVEDRNVGYRFTKKSLSWEVTKRWNSWKVYCKALTGKEALEVMEDWTKQKKKEIIRLNKAIEFATKKHNGQFRKSTTIPYILHPLEVMQILYSMRADTNVMIAGVLHDTVEDTDTTIDEIRGIFGDDVAQLVASNTEDKSKCWDERKQHTIKEMANADLRVKMLIMADKLSNLRSIATDYENIGEKLWERFNAPKEKQCRYYDGILDNIYDMQFVPECEKAYWEFTGLFKDVFVKYYFDESEMILYQVVNDDVVYCLKRGNPQWNKIGTQANLFPGDKKNEFILMQRKDAEFAEEVWNKPFWDCHINDIKDGEYSLFDSDRRCIRINITNSRLTFSYRDYGKDGENTNENDEYEFSYSLDEEKTRRFLVQLRIKCGTGKPLEHILMKEYGKDDGGQLFKNFCEEIGVFPQFYSI